MKWINANPVVSLSIMLFLISLTQDAYYIDRNDYDAYSNSLMLLLMGWLGMMSGGAGLCWVANPLLFLSWFLYRANEKNVAALISSLAFVASVSFLFFDEVLSSEAPTYSKITEYKLGYWLWLSSCTFMAFSSIYKVYIDKITSSSQFDVNS
jgi:hypothetical protein